MFSELNTRPGCTSVNASPCRLPDTTHHSRPRRLARSYLVRLFHSLLSSGLRRLTLTPLSGVVDAKGLVGDEHYGHVRFDAGAVLHELAFGKPHERARAVGALV